MIGGGVGGVFGRDRQRPKLVVIVFIYNIMITYCIYLFLSFLFIGAEYHHTWCAGHSGVEVTLMPMEATFTPGFVLLLAGVGFLSLLILLLFLLLCQRAFKHKQGYQLPSLQVSTHPLLYIYIFCI